MQDPVEGLDVAWWHWWKGLGPSDSVDLTPTTFAVMRPAHPPGDDIFSNAAELKRHFQSHPSQRYKDTSLQSWVGGRSFKGHAYNLPRSKWQWINHLHACYGQPSHPP